MADHTLTETLDLALRGRYEDATRRALAGVPVVVTRATVDRTTLDMFVEDITGRQLSDLEDAADDADLDRELHWAVQDVAASIVAVVTDDVVEQVESVGVSAHVVGIGGADTLSRTTLAAYETVDLADTDVGREIYGDAWQDAAVEHLDPDAVETLRDVAGRIPVAEASR